MYVFNKNKAVFLVKNTNEEVKSCYVGNLNLKFIFTAGMPHYDINYHVKNVILITFKVLLEVIPVKLYK